MPKQIESLYHFNSMDMVSIHRHTCSGLVEVWWWATTETNETGEVDVYVVFEATEANIAAFKAGKMTARALWRAAPALSLRPDPAPLAGPQSKSVSFEQAEEYCPPEGVYINRNLLPES